jgi:PIN domain nuclease of toxin-antitoxin system
MENPANSVLVSAASLWEIAIKHRIGKLNAPVLLQNFQHELDEEGFVELPITARHGVTAGLLPGSHKDPFDRLLVAQASVEGVPIVSRDPRFDEYPIQRIW